MNSRIALLTTALVLLPVIASAHNSAGNNNGAAEAYMHAMTKMNDQVHNMTPTGDPNKDFVMMMEPHHQAAVDMAKDYLKYGNDPKLKSMAKKIISSQEKEIAEMKNWKSTNGL